MLSFSTSGRFISKFLVAIEVTIQVKFTIRTNIGELAGLKLFKIIKWEPYKAIFSNIRSDRKTKPGKYFE